MLILLKNAKVYAPELLGQKDVLIANGKIEAIENEIKELPVSCTVVDLEGKSLTTGFIDQHIHLTGGGGEGGFKTRVPEIQLSTLTKAGITSVVGTLGTDGDGRTVENLLAKVNGLNEEGYNAWFYSGAYPLDARHLCGNLRRDILFLDRCIGGKIAMSDHRSSMPTVADYAKLVAEARIGGMMSGKVGVLHVHMGDGKRGLGPIFDIVEGTEIPITQFRPTHVNRNRMLLDQTIEFARQGGYMDLTCCMVIPTDVAVKDALAAGVPFERITMSSDGNGSCPKFDDNGEMIGVTAANPKFLMDEAVALIKNNTLTFEKAVALISTNVADALKLPNKGHVAVGMDADLLVWNDDYTLKQVYVNGKLMVEDGVALVKGAYED